MVLNAWKAVDTFGGPKSPADCQWLKNGCAPKDCYIAGIIITEWFEDHLWNVFKDIKSQQPDAVFDEFVKSVQDAFSSPFGLLEARDSSFLSRYVCSCTVRGR